MEDANSVRRDIDLDVATRQAIGNNAIASKYYKKQAAAIMKGRLRMPPHPTWDFEPPINWASDPFGDRNWCFQFHGLRWLNPVRHAALAGDSEAREFWVRTVVSWISNNPSSDPPSQWSWVNMAEALRALEMVYGLCLAEGDDRDYLLGSLVEHGEWLYDPARIVSGNHGLHQHQGLFVLGRLFGRDDWVEAAVSRLESDFVSAFDDQGVNNEGALAYHHLNLKWWLLAWRRLEIEGIERPQGAEQRLRLATAAIHHMRRPDGKFEQIGDTDEVGLSRDDIEELSFNEFRPRADETEACFKEGYFFGRSGWGRGSRSMAEETFYSLRFGRTDRYHAHDDSGSVTFYSRGHQWLTDSGRFSYQTADPMRQYVRSRSAHNVVHLPGRKRDRGTAVDVVRYVSNSDVVDIEVADKTYAEGEVRRRLIYVRYLEALIVIDDISGMKGLGAEQLWHIAPDIEVESAKQGLRLSSGPRMASLIPLDRAAELTVHSASEGNPMGWVSPKWKVSEPGTLVSRTADTEAASMACMILSHPKYVHPTVRVTPRSGRPSVIEVETGIEVTRIEVEPDGVNVDVRRASRGGLIDIMFSLESDIDGLRREIRGE